MSQSQKYREVYELYQLCTNGKDLKEFCIEAGVNYNKFTEWQRKQLWNEKFFNGSVDMRKGVYGLSEVVRHDMKENPNNPNNVYIFMSKNRRIIKILHYERGFYILYEKRPLMGQFKKPVYDEKSKSYQINWNDMVYLTESLVINQISLSKAV